MSKHVYPFWATGKNGTTPKPVKLPKMFRVKGTVSSRALKSIVVDKKTGNYEVRTIENSKKNK